MIIGDRLRRLREDKDLSQGEMENRTGLLRCYISRVENGHTVPSIETLEKLARALEVPLYQLFYEGQGPPDLPALLGERNEKSEEWGVSRKTGHYIERLRSELGRMGEGDRKLLLSVLLKMTRKNRA
jgi:transcriptional regulator with XRE-family HTH domain